MCIKNLKKVMWIITVIFLHLLSIRAEECNANAKCLTCPEGAPFLCTSCEKGFHLARGGAYYYCKQCPDACTACDDRFTCTFCQAGRYGSECLDICGKGCINATCEQYLGYCDCMTNFTGTKCDRCVDGKYDYKSNCESDCSVNCQACISDANCTLCKDGYFGAVCDKSCSEGCYSSVCHQGNGTCLENKCKRNYNGVKCDKCVPGRYGNNCASVCPEGCISCQSEKSCNMCKAGHWGRKCEHNCSHGCLESLCSKETGMCKHNKCRPGFIGDACVHCIPGKHGFNCNMNDTIESNTSRSVNNQLHVLVTVLPFLFSRITGTV